jgi:hypothetical protein
MANQFQEMIRELNAANKAAEKAARVNVPPKPGSPTSSVHPVIRLHTALGRIKHDPNTHRGLRNR